MFALLIKVGIKTVVCISRSGVGFHSLSRISANDQMPNYWLNENGTRELTKITNLKSNF